MKLLIAALVSGCTGIVMPEQVSTPSVQTTLTQSRNPEITISPTSPQTTVTQEGTIPGTSPSPGIQNVPTILSDEIITTPVNGELERLIDIAKQDLARRLEITPAEIEVVHIEKAEWPDTSLGCAEPGLSRRPVAIPGFRVTLSVRDREYVYHTGKESGVVYCPKG